jgi:hypothetical protein
MSLDREEQAVILYALHRCGGKGRKARIIHYIMTEGLLKTREGDTQLRETSETKLENDLAWARQDLKDKGFLAMPENGVWQLTNIGRDKLFKIALAVHEKSPDVNWFQRYSEKFLAQMSALGEHLQSQIQQQGTK